MLGGRQLVAFSLRFLGQDLHRDESWGELAKKGGWGCARKGPNGLRIHRASAGADFVTCQDSETTANHLMPPANYGLQPKSDVTASRTRPTGFAFLAKHRYCNAACPSIS